MRRISPKMLLTALLCVALTILARGDVLRAQDIAPAKVLNVDRQLVDDSVKDEDLLKAVVNAGYAATDISLQPKNN